MAKNARPGARKSKRAVVQPKTAASKLKQTAPKRGDDPSHFPALGRAMLGLDDMKNVNRIVYGLYAVCAGLFVADFLYHKHVYLEMEKIPGFYALYGFFMCAALVICARGMRVFLKRREDFYAPYDVDSEPYPEDQLDRKNVDG
jgi:hypothetical protein